MRKLRTLMLAMIMGLMTTVTLAPAMAHHHEEPTQVSVQAEASDPANIGGGESTGAAPSDGKKGEEAPALLDLMNPNFGGAVWNLVTFVCLMLLLCFVVWPKILAGLKAREEKIRDDLASAESSAKEAASKVKEYEAKLAAAAEEAKKVVDQARLDAEALKSRLTTETEAEIDKMKARAAEEIKLAKQQAIQDLYASSAQLATAVAGKLIQREITATDTQTLVDQTVSELGKAG